jgi:hypothetical protein
MESWENSDPGRRKIMSPVRLVYLVVIGAALGVPTTSAQTQPAAAALTHVEGAVYLDDQPVGSLPRDVVLGDAATVRTTDGRAVLALKRGGVLALAEHTLVRVLANGRYNFNHVQVLEGTAVVISATSTPLMSCRSDVRLSSSGAFRFDVEPTQANGTAKCRFRVYDGSAAVPLVSVTSALRSGQAMSLDPRCGDMIPTWTFAPEQLDDFDRWTRQHATEEHGKTQTKQQP